MSITSVRSGVFSLVFALAAFIVLPISALADTQMITTNPGFETGASGWTNDATAGAVYSVSNTAFHSGTNSAQISIAAGAYVAGTDAKWYFTPNINATTTQQHYIFSDWYKSATTTSVFVYLSNGSIQWIGDAAPSPSTFSQFTNDFLIPAGITFTVGHALESAGTLNTDDYSLLRSDVTPTFAHGLVTLSFDDGWKTYGDNAFPILSAAGIKNTAYIITMANTTDPTDYMATSTLTTINASGLVEIGSHTRNHLDLVKDLPASFGYADEAALRQGEINDARTDLTRQGFGLVDTFAYPYGSYDASVKALVQSAGYIGARSVDQGYNLVSTDKYALKQQHITNTTTFAEAKSWIDTATSTKTWLIFMFHDVRQPSDLCVDRENKDVADQDCTNTTLLQQIVDYLKVAPAGTVVTVREGIGQMGATPPPTPVIAAHANVFADATSTNTNVAVTYTNPTVTPAGTVSCTPASGSLFNIGSTTVTCTSVGAANTTFVVGVRAHTAPAATSVATSTLTGVATPVTLVGSGSGTLTFSVVAGPHFGTLSGSGANQVYTPQASTTAFVDTFTFKVNDGQVDSNVATATITVSLAPDVTAPTISAISSGTPNQHDVTITWTTNEAATSQVKYGTTTSYSASTTIDNTQVTAHSVQIAGLDTATAYHFVVTSKDAAGNATTSADQTFTTASAPIVTPPSTGGGCSGCGCGGCGGGGGSPISGPLSIGYVNHGGSNGQVLGASTQVLTDAQINAILNLLKSFNADQSVIDNVSKALRGTGGTSGSTGKYVFTKTLVLGSNGTDVLELQKILIAEGFLKVANPSLYFRSLTQAALKLYQAKHGIEQTGTVGPKTRAELNK
jgi:peptidoglycan/xylan/chitin deacetylase (PgdA/CDA1 family)